MVDGMNAVSTATVPSDAADLLLVLRDLQKKLNELESRYQTLASPIGSGHDVLASPGGAAENNAPNDPTEEKEANAPADAQETAEKKPSRVKIIVSKRDADGTPIETEELPKSQQENLVEHAFILRKTVHPPGRSDDDYSEIDISSPGLWDLMKELLGWYPYHVFRDSPTTLYSPFEYIIFDWDKLQKAADQTPKDERDKQAREDLRSLLDTIGGGSSGDPNLDKYLKARPSYKKAELENEGVETIRFRDLWTIFPPGTLVFGRPFQNEDQVFIVQDNCSTWAKDIPGRTSAEQEKWKLDAWSYDWKDGNFKRTNFVLLFDPFEGHRPLTSLQYYPFHLHREYDSVRESLIRRGKDFRELCNVKEGPRLYEYDGNAIVEKKGFSGLLQGNAPYDPMADFMSSEVDFRRTREVTADQAPSNKMVERVIVDYASYFEYGPNSGRNGELLPGDQYPNCVCSDCERNEDLMQRYRVRFDHSADQAEWEPEQYLLCPPRVLGYILRSKQWAQLQVNKHKPIPENFDSDAWESRLKLDNKDTKTLLFDLVLSHRSESSKGNDEPQGLEVDDIVPGKGKGLIILLYGPPGVGKTTTAETIALAAGRPLFSVSVADVGTQAKHVESNLRKIFELATKWKAILLIDEADVFLESRGRGGVVQSTEKNALVSVFLRVLEYYHGIMFLTTNQIAEFDVAIPSRIHIAIKYQSLNAGQMEAIFTGFLDRLGANGLIKDYDEIKEWLRDDVFQEEFDGRQIRNIVTTSLSLARAEKEHKKGSGMLTKEHLKRTFNNAKRFKSDFTTAMERYKESQGKMIK